jgi:hypothetical protein
LLGGNNTRVAPLVYTSIDHAANKSVIIILDEAKFVRLVAFQRYYTIQELVELSRSSDFIAMTQSLLCISDLGIPTIYSRESRLKHLSLSNYVSSLIRKRAEEEGYPVSSKYTAIHTRDAAYKQQPALRGRDSDVNVLVEALMNFRPKVSKVIRLGVGGIQVKHASILSYDATIDVNKIDDGILLLNSNKLFGTSSGPGHYAASLFGVPTLFLNSTTLLPCHTLLNQTIISLKRILYIPGDTVDERLASLLRVWFDGSSIEFCELNSRELAADIADFNSFLEKGTQLKSLSSIVKSSDFCHQSILESIFLTDRCFYNLHTTLLGVSK